MRLRSGAGGTYPFWIYLMPPTTAAVADGIKMKPIKIAIVGSEGKYWTPETRTKAVKEIEYILHYLSMPTDISGNKIEFDSDEVILVSGGCPKGGVDIWAEIVADVLGILKEIHYPEVNQWEDEIRVGVGDIVWDYEEKIKKGYKSRNIEIAESCDILYCINPKGRDWSGGRWTLSEAKRRGKETHLVEIV